MARGSRQQRGQRAGAGQGRASSEAYLEKNAAKPSVETLASGLQIEHIDHGDGDAVQPNSIVTVDQRVRLIDGKVIGDTFHDGRPDTFPLHEGVEGYQEGLLLMRVGGRAVITCPPDLAWGKKGAGKKIPPNAVLIFDVRLRQVR